MGNVVIPGDELEQLIGVLPRIEDLLGSADQAGRAAGSRPQGPPAATPSGIKGGFAGAATGGGPLPTAGDPTLADAIANFDSRWSDGHYQIGKEVQNLHDAAQNILDLFSQTDQDLADALHGKTPREPKDPTGGLTPHLPGVNAPKLS